MIGIPNILTFNVFIQSLWNFLLIKYSGVCLMNFL